MKLILIAVIISLCSFTIIIFNKVTNKHVTKHTQQVSIVVDNLHPGITIPSHFLGLSFEITSLTDTVYFKANHKKFKNLLTNLGDGVLRLNGYYINFVPWSSHKRTLVMTRSNKNYLTDSIATSDLDSLFSFIRPTNWKVILGIQLLNSNPDRAVSEVNYAWTKGKDVIYAFEIGNENDHAFGPDFKDYYSHFVAQVNAIKSSIKDAPLCGPATVHPEGAFLVNFVNKCANEVNFITIHDYSIGDNKIKNNVSQLLNNKGIAKATVNFQLADSLGKKVNKKYRVSECNNYGDGGTGVSEKFASALWGVDYLFTAAANSSTGINFHGGSRGFTPIIIKNGQPMTPQPLYYAMLFFHLASQGKLLPVEVISGDSQVKAYAVLSPANKIMITLLNKDSVNDKSIQIRCKSNFSKASLIQLNGSSVSTSNVTLGGSSIDSYGNWKPTVISNMTSNIGVFKITVSKGSASLLTVN